MTLSLIYLKVVEYYLTYKKDDSIFIFDFMKKNTNKSVKRLIYERKKKMKLKAELTAISCYILKY